jgi:hypothetical protein
VVILFKKEFQELQKLTDIELQKLLSVYKVEIVKTEEESLKNNLYQNKN